MPKQIRGRKVLLEDNHTYTSLVTVSDGHRHRLPDTRFEMLNKPIVGACVRVCVRPLSNFSFP